MYAHLLYKKNIKKPFQKQNPTDPLNAKKVIVC